MSDVTAGAAFGGRRSKLKTTLIAVGGAIALTVVLTSLLHTRVALDADEAVKQPLPVPVEEFVLQDSYQREVSFLGLVRAGRASNIGFEVPGSVAELKVREGSIVEQGAVLAQLDTAQLSARRSAVAADLSRVEAELELAKIKAKRQRDLQATGAVSEEAFDETRLRARALEAQLENVRAQLAGIDIDLEKSTLRAPYAGVVAERLVNEGAVVNMGTPVLRLVADGEREAHIGIAAEQTALLEVGAVYPLVLRGQRFEATLRSIRPDVDPQTLTATAVFALPENVQGFDGEPVNLKLAETIESYGGWLPMSALLEGERGLWTVLRLDSSAERPVAVREAVEVLEVQGERAFVRGTLIDRARVVTDGVHRVTPGTPLAPQEA